MVCILNQSKQESVKVETNQQQTPKSNDNNTMEVDESATNDDGLMLKRITGGNLIQHTPLYSANGESLYIVERNVVHVYSVTTGEWMKDFEKSTSDIISLQFDFFNKKILVGCTKSGELIRWKSKSGRIENKGNLMLRNCEITSFHLLDILSPERTPYALVTYKEKNEVKWSIFDVNKAQSLNVPRVFINLTNDNVISMAETSKFHYFAIAQNHIINLVDYKNWRYKPLINANKAKVTVIKAHPKEEMIATGDEEGRIFLWRQLFGRDYPPTTIYHWHHTPVTGLAFSEYGAGFYSSGQEAVLVKWNIDRPEMRQFVPRMAAIIQHIAVAPENKTVAVCTADNAVQILGDDNNTKCTLQNFTYVYGDKTELEKFPIGIKLNPQTNSIVLNGRVGHLQFYSTYTKTLLYNLDIVMQNRLSREKDKILYDIRVTHADFNINWMATGEIFDDQEHLPEMRLKFWEFKKELQNYELNTNIELPHEIGFKDIKFSNPSDVDNLLCATAGLDNVIKIWSLDDSDNIYKEGKIWYCIAQTSYKNLPLSSINFSQDGSLLSAGFGNNLCVYNAETLKLKTVLTAPGGFDGTLQKVQVHIPKGTVKAGDKSLREGKERLLKLFSNLLENNEQTLFKEIKKEQKKQTAKPVNPKSKIDTATQEKLYKKILSLTELNLFQKILLYQKLGIYCTSSNPTQDKFRAYMSLNIMNSNSADGVLNDKLRKSSVKDRFKAKHRLNKYVSWQRVCENDDAQDLIPLLSLLDIKRSAKSPGRKQYRNCNGTGNALVNGDSKKFTETVVPPVQGVSIIKQVLFGSGEFAHLVIVCTAHRILIWNLLSLKLQSVLKLSVDQITIDPLTNLIAAVTTNRELYVFLPNTPMAIYHRRGLPKMLGACWVPRRYPKSQSMNIDWQTTSTLYFLTDSQHLVCLGTDNDSDILEGGGAILSETSDALRYSTFGTFAANKTNDTNKSFRHGNVSIGVPGKTAVKSLIDMAAHTMPRLNLVCNEFLKAMLSITKPSEEEDATRQSNSNTADQPETPESDDESEQTNIRRAITEKTKEATVEATSVAEKLKEDERLRKIATETINIEF